MQTDWALVIPMANEEKDFDPFIKALTHVLDSLGSGKVYLVVDNVSKDRTLELCADLSLKDKRFETVFEPANRNVVDAYIKGYKVAYEQGHDFIIEMDAGLSHDPAAIPIFLEVLTQGYECAFGSRFIKGGSLKDSSLYRRFLSGFGTILSNVLLGTKMKDMTSGYQGFHRDIVGKMIAYSLKSQGHFYQTELRYLLRKKRYKEVPIHYKAPSPSVSRKSVTNSIETLLIYFFKRIIGNPPSL
jgi:dolichol-phosphate mannosyltransferase